MVKLGAVFGSRSLPGLKAKRKDCGASPRTPPPVNRSRSQPASTGQKRTRGPAATSQSRKSQKTKAEAGVTAPQAAAAGAAAPTDDAEVGVTTESEAQHRRRHAFHDKPCPRCDYYKRKAAWAMSALDFDGAESWGAGRGMSWLAERPASMPGVWGLGCCVCAAAAHMAQQEPRSARASAGGHRQWSSKWARYEIRIRDTRFARSKMDLHAQTAQHRRAVLFLRKKVADPSVHLAQATVAKSELSLQAWRGRVPQVQAWVDAWAETSSSLSFRKQATVQCKKAGVTASALSEKAGVTARRVSHAAHRKLSQKLLTIMSEVVRQSCRQEIRCATSVALAVDGRGKRKVVRYRCDMPKDTSPTFPEQGGALLARGARLPFTTGGVLGVVTFTVDSLEEAQEDHAVVAAGQLEQLFKDFCTPLGGTVDSELFDHLVAHVRVLAADGGAAERKALLTLVSRLCPNVILLIRDMAHAARIAAKTPLHNDATFGAIWEELFNKEHALVADFQHSDKLKALLQTVQKGVVRIPALPGQAQPAMDTVLKHLSFAKQRFDSFAVPAAKLAALLMPVATVLAHVSCDGRVQSIKRARAADMLKALTPRFCMALGLSADFGLLVADFIRTWDKASHDIANSTRELAEFSQQMTAVFKEAFVFCTEAQQPGDRGAPTKILAGEFVTNIVRKQLSQRCVFQAGREQVMLWGPVGPGDVKDLSQRMHLVVDEMIRRLRADFDNDVLRRSFSAFDLVAVEAAFSEGPSTGEQRKQRDEIRQTCLKGIRQLAAAAGLDTASCVLEYSDTVPAILEHWKEAKRVVASSGASTGRKSGCLERPDNRSIWCQCLREDFPVPPRRPGRSKGLSCLRVAVRIYISVLDGECQVERDLGRMSSEAQEHCNINAGGLSDVMVLLSRGPRAREDWLSDEGPTEFAEQCVALWRQTYGARLGIGGGGRKPKEGTRTWKAVHEKVRVAARGAVLRSKTGLRGRADLGTLFGGLPRTELRASAESNERLWTKKHDKFAADTRKKSESSRARLQVVLGGTGLQPQLNRRTAAPELPEQHPLQNARSICFGDFAGEVPGHGACQAVSARHADVVIIPSLRTLFDLPAGFLPTMCYIVLCGRPVVVKAAWDKARARPSRVPIAQVVLHQPACTTKTTLCMTSALATEHRSLARSFRKGSEGNAKVRFEVGLTTPPASATIFSSIDDVRRWLANERRVRNYRGRPVMLQEDGVPLQ